jgi:hypothetical protein
MKRSEVIRRGREGHPAGPTRSAGGGLLATLTDDSLLALATALGIEVEPDEVPLPERLVLSARDEYGPSGPERSMRDFNGNGGHILVFSRAGNAKALLDALISAYNERPRWRTGEPEGAGWYLVYTEDGALEVDHFDDGEWAYGYGERCYDHWMPLPAPPGEAK